MTMLVLLALWITPLSPAAPPPAADLLDEILTRHAAAMGGHDHWAQLQTLFIRLDTGDGGVMEAYTKRPDKFKLVMRFQEYEWIKSWDGRDGWTRYNGEENPMNAGEAREMAEEPYFFDELLLARELGYEVKLLTKEKLQGKTVFKIEVTKAPDDIVTYYLNANTFLIERIGETSHDPKWKDTYFTTIFQDYQNWGGLTIPGRWGIVVGDQKPRWMEVEQVMVDAPIDDAIFDK